MLVEGLLPTIKGNKERREMLPEKFGPVSGKHRGGNMFDVLQLKVEVN